MKITRSRLMQIIKEEVLKEQALEEQDPAGDLDVDEGRSVSLEEGKLKRIIKKELVAILSSARK